MNPLEQAEALANKLGLEPESDDDDYLETIQKHMEAFARESRPTWIEAKELKAELAQIKESDIYQDLVDALKENAQLKEANRELLKDQERLDWLEQRWVMAGRPIMSGPEFDCGKGEIRKALDKATLAKERTE